MMAFAHIHLVDPHVHHPGHVHLCVGGFHVGYEHAPQPSVILSQNLLPAPDRHLLHQGQGKRLEILGEVLAFAFPRHLHRPDLFAALASRSWWRTNNLRPLPKGI